MRCAKPVPFDLDYTRTLGYGAVRYLIEGGSGALIALSGGRVVPVRLEELPLEDRWILSRLATTAAASDAAPKP